jgi:hypothetical protein
MSLLSLRVNSKNSTEGDSLNGGATIPFKQIGSFANKADARIRLANKISDTTSLRNISSSFNIENFVCNTCTVRGEHQVLGKKSEGDDGTRQSPPLLRPVGPKIPLGNSGGEEW